MRRLIINADDFGYTPAVSEGIVEAHAAGVVTSASLLANLDGFDHAVRLARAAAPALGIGLHLNLVQGRPLARVPTLTDPRTGAFHPLARLARRAVLGRVAAADVEAECRAQIRRLRDAGVRITHLDSHQHAHALPGLWPAIARAAMGAGIAVARWPVESARVNPWRLGAQGKKAVVALSWRLARRGAPRLRHPDRFVGISLMGGRGVERRLLRLLDTLPSGTTELMVHVGRVDHALARVDDYTWQREQELEALRSSAVRARLQRGDIALVHFGALA